MSRSPKSRTMHAAHQTPMVRRKSYVKSTEEWEEEWTASRAWSLQEGDTTGEGPLTEV